jgi:FAD/FMN-containing dehydrogenase
MPVSYSKKRVRDRALHERWNRTPDSQFAKIGISRDAIKAAQLQLQGRIVLPGDPDYDKDRLLFNPVFDPYPAMIIYCTVKSDVAVALHLARRGGTTFAVRSSGHCTAGFSANSGVLIDVSALNAISVDPRNLTATVGPGCEFGPLHQELSIYGLHVPGSECPDVCVGGHVQGGGYGFTAVTFGMNCDHVIAMQVMLADGSLVMASQTENYDLWWAMRGGTGGNFGVLLEVTYRLQKLDPCFGWALAWPLANPADLQRATDVLMLLQRSYMLSSSYAPQMNIQVSLCYQTQLYVDPAPPPTPTPLPYLMVRGLYSGEEAAGQAAIQALKQMPDCVTQWTMMSTFVDLNDKLLNLPQSMPLLPSLPFEDKQARYVERNLSAAEWTAILQHFIKSPNAWSYMYLEFYGGAINSYPTDQSAFVHRNAAFNAVMDVFWFENNEREAAETFLNGWTELMAPMWNGQVYQNYCSLELRDYAENYWGNAWAGLWAVKQKYDPDNAFTFEQAICPPRAMGGPGSVLPPSLKAALAQPIQYVSRATI